MIREALRLISERLISIRDVLDACHDTSMTNLCLREQVFFGAQQESCHIPKTGWSTRVTRKSEVHLKFCGTQQLACKSEVYM